MDDCANLEKTLAIAKQTLAKLEQQKAGHTFLSMPPNLEVDLEEKRKEVAELEARLTKATVPSEKKETQQAAQSGLNRPSPMRSRVPNEHYIERDEAKRFLESFERALQKPEGQPLLFNICGIGGVGKTTLLGRLQEAHTEVNFLEVCFAKTADIETPLKLMRKLHQQARDLSGSETSTDAFAQREQEFTTTLFELSQRSIDGTETSSEDARKITSWFERLVWLGTTSFASISNQLKSYETSGSGFAPLGAIGEDAEGLKEWIQQRVRNHPATKDQPALQALMLEPVSKLTQAFAESLMQVAQRRERSLVLILDTYEKAQAYLNQWLWQYLVEDTPLASSPVRLVVVGRRSLQIDEGWRKLNQDRKLLHETSLKKFDKKKTEDYLQQIGIQSGGTRAKIHKVTQGLPYYLDWVRKQREGGKEPDFSKGNQAIAELLLQGIDSQQRKILQVVACCRWFDLAMIRYLLGRNISGLQQANDTAEDYFEWLKHSDFVEFSNRHYRLDDVARDVFRQSYFQDDQSQFRKTNTFLADYFKQQADELVDPQSPLPDPYEDEEWRRQTAELLYYSLFGKGREGLQQYIEQVFIAAYLREPDVFMAPFAFIKAELSEESPLLPNATGKFFKDSTIALRFGWFFLHQPPKSYKLEFEGEDNLSEEEIEARLQKVENSLQVLLEQVGNLQDGFSKGVGLMYKSLRCNRSRDIIDSLLQAKSQAEQLTTRCRPKLLHSLFSNLGSLLNNVERYQDALDCCEKALELWEGNLRTFLTKGVALGKLEQYEAALEIFQKATDLDPKSVDAWRNRGAALSNLERYEAALESYQKAIDLDPKSVNTWINRGDALRELKQYSEALVACDRALEIDPESSGALNSQALTLSFLKEFGKAIVAIDKAIKLKPEEVLFTANRGIVLARAGRYAEALAACEQAVKQDPKHESGYYAKACYYALQGELEQAINNLRKSIEIASRLSRNEAKYNPDFDGIRDDKQFRALVYLE